MIYSIYNGRYLYETSQLTDGGHALHTINVYSRRQCLIIYKDILKGEHFNAGAVYKNYAGPTSEQLGFFWDKKNTRMWPPCMLKLVQKCTDSQVSSETSRQEKSQLARVTIMVRVHSECMHEASIEAWWMLIILSFFFFFFFCRPTNPIWTSHLSKKYDND